MALIWPNGSADQLIDPLGSDWMDQDPHTGPQVVQQINALLRLIISTLGVLPGGSFPDVTSRLASLMPLAGGTVTGPLTFTGALATLTLAAGPNSPLHPATKAYIDASIAALFPGGVILTSLADRDTVVYTTSGNHWINVASGL